MNHQRTVLFVCLHGMEAPRPIDAALAADRVIAIRNPLIRFEVPGAGTWDLTAAEFDEHMRDEIRDRVEALAGELGLG